MWTVLFLVACTGSSPPAAPEPPDEPVAQPAPAPSADPRFALDGASCDPALATRDADPHDLAGAAIVCLREGRSGDARTLVEVAIGRDGADPFVAFAYARTLMVQRLEDGNGCDRDAYLQAVLERLATVATDEALRGRLIDDDVFAEVRTAWSFRHALGADGSRAEAFVGTRWYSPGEGAFGSTRRLHLSGGGEAVMHELVIDDDGEPRWTQTHHTWRLVDGAIVVGEGDDAVRYTLTERGELSDGGPRVAFRDHPSECEA